MPEQPQAPAPAGQARAPRETRLLVATLIVSALVLLLLAQLRFPDNPDLVVDATAQPLDRLAARASYDELAAGVARVEAQIFPNLVVLQLAAPDDDSPRALADVLSLDTREVAPRHVPALRTSGITALATLGPDARVTGVVGREGQAAGVARIIAADPLRRVAVVNVPLAAARTIVRLPLASLQTPTYVVAIEGTSAGITARPIFLGNRERYVATRWSRPLLPLGGSAVAPGALIFSLDSQFIGAVVREGGTLAIAEAQDVYDTIDQLSAGVIAGPADAGLSVQALTPALAIATGTATGVVIADVDPEGPAAGLVRPGDVVTRVEGQPVTSPEELLLRVAEFTHGASVRLGVTRDGEPLDVSVMLALAPAIADGSAPGEPVLEADPAGVRVVVVPPGSALAEGGVRAGDLVVRAVELDAPTPGALADRLAATAPGDFTLLIVRRDGRQLVLAVPGGPPADDVP
jgi:S1-C subfamily serine protease